MRRHGNVRRFESRVFDVLAKLVFGRRLEIVVGKATRGPEAEAVVVGGVRFEGGDAVENLRLLGWWRWFGVML
jgi:hypothetical protein